MSVYFLFLLLFLIMIFFVYRDTCKACKSYEYESDGNESHYWTKVLTLNRHSLLPKDEILCFLILQNLIKYNQIHIKYFYEELCM